MGGRNRFSMAVVFVALALALVAVPAAMASQRLAEPNAAVAAVPVSSPALRASHGMLRLYAQPDLANAEFSWMMPSVPLWILGMSDDLAFYAVTTSEKSTAIRGWVGVGEVSYKPVMERANRLAMVYRQRDTASEIVNVLHPEQAVRLFGISPDGRWAAVASLGDRQATGWVPTSDLRRDYAAAQMTGSTKTHMRPDADSPVLETLSLGQRVVLTGRTADGAWVALMSQDDKRFLGWARPGIVQHGMNLAALPALA